MPTIDNPPHGWMLRLRQGNRVWLPKENCEATIEWPYEPEDPGHSCGRVGIRRPWHDTWLIDADGKGIDGKPIMMPIEGELPENPPPLPVPEIRRLRAALEVLARRVMVLERIVLRSPEAILAEIDDDILRRIVSVDPGSRQA